MKIQDPEPNQNEKKDPDPWQNITDALCLYLLHPLTGIVQAYIFYYSLKVSIVITLIWPQESK